MTAVALWPEERAALRPPEQLTVSEWADRYRQFDPINYATVGQWDTATAEYQREMMDAILDAAVRWVVFMTSTQVGKSQCMLNQILYTADADPQPSIVVLPTEDDVTGFNTRTLMPAIDYSPQVAQHKTDRKADWKGSELSLNGMVLYMKWAGSAAKLARLSGGRVWCDEVDKYPDFAGKEADPVALVAHRLRWFKDEARLIASSTPTTTAGQIWRLWQKTDQRWFHVPCPFCGEFQPLKFSRETVWFPPEVRDSDKIKSDRLAHYVCRKCEKRIPDDDVHKKRMLAGGVWCPEGGRVARDGKVRGAKLDASRRGYHVNALYSPVLSWSDVAAEFLDSRHDMSGLMDFTNGWLGWPWIEKTSETTTEEVRQRAVSVPEGMVPNEAVVITAGADVQKSVIYYVIRAWGVGPRSVTIKAGTVDSFEQLALVLFHTAYHKVGESDQAMGVRLACVDSGYRQDEVYAFCAKFPDSARPTKGWQKRQVPFTATKIERDWLGRSGGLQLWNVDVSYYKDVFTRQMRIPFGEPSCWNVHANPSEPYLLQVTSEHKVPVRKKGQQVAEEWRVKPGAQGNHWFDCEVGAQVAADMLGINALTDDVTDQGVATYQQARDATRSPKEAEDDRRERRRSSSSRRGGSLSERRKDWKRRRR